MYARITCFLLAAILFSGNLLAEKKALIIAIGDYPSSSGWMRLSSENDVKHIQSALLMQGFSTDNMAVIKDREASFKGIQRAFQQLFNNAETGDILYIHYSGHGQQVLDDSGDELDGLDEAIVPYDSPKFFEEGVYEGERLYRDDRLNAWLGKLRKKIGEKGQIFLVLDSCHSGTGTRGFGKARGTDVLMAPHDFKPSFERKESGSFMDHQGNLGSVPWVAFYGSSARELNFETTDRNKRAVGSLSYVLSKTLANLHSGCSYADLFEKVRIQMQVEAPKQNPQYEGIGSQLVFKKASADYNHYYNCIRQIDPQTIEVQVGLLQDVFDGSIAQLISAENEAVICKGDIKSASLTTSILKLECPVDLIKDDVLYKVEILEKATPPIQLELTVDVDSRSEWHELAEEIQALEFISALSHTNAHKLFTENENLVLQSKEGKRIWVSNTNNSLELNKEILLNELKAINQCQFLRKFEETNYSISMDIQLVDQKTKQALTNQQLRVGSELELSVRNTGLREVYFSIIDIQPDNVINMLVPPANGRYTAEEFYLLPGQEMTIPYHLRIAPPLGKDVLKLILTEKPVNLNAIISNKGNRRSMGQAQSPFERLLALSYNNTRSYKRPRLKTGSLAVHGYVFEIVE
ncbi:MAG TPA: caspase family protein [Saprospiraceae bacterium]|nr:caspase family protein [Saprospiraceae bacterium]